MTTPDEMDGKRTSTVPATTENSSTDTSAKPGDAKDPNLYDPVGMAGKKAGIVVEIEQQIVQEGTGDGTETPAGTGGGPGKEKG